MIGFSTVFRLFLFLVTREDVVALLAPSTTLTRRGAMTSLKIISSSDLEIEPMSKIDTDTLPFDTGKHHHDGILRQHHHACSRKKWGVDNRFPSEYWFDKRIHSLGNHGFMGAVHAAMAPVATKAIDMFAYDGVDLRKKVAEELSSGFGKAQARVVDLCCGVGTSTRALRDALPDGTTVIGLDTSPQMVAMAEFLTLHLNLVKPFYDDLVRLLAASAASAKTSCSCCSSSSSRIAKFLRGNAEDTKLPEESFDLVTIMYAFHEAPKLGRAKMLDEARRLLTPGGTLAVVDICVDYRPSLSMLIGEPYVLEYQQNIHNQLGCYHGFLPAQYKILVPGHVGMWLLQRAPTPSSASAPSSSSSAAAAAAPSQQAVVVSS